MAKKKRGKKKKGKKKGKTGKKTSAKVAPYYPVVLTPNYKFGNIISKQIEDNRRNNSEAAARVREGGILIPERSLLTATDERGGSEDGQSRLLSLARLTLDELPLGLPKLASNLTALDLSGNRLFDIDLIGRSLSQLYELREINLSTNSLTGPLPSLNLKHLELFSANHNQITSLPDTFANESPNLITLNLQNNQLNSFSELYSQHWKNIRVINVNKNKLTCLPSNVGDFDRLEALKCNQNTIAILPTSIGKCKHLQMLDIGENSILSLPVELENNQNLKTLNVSKNGLTRIDGNLLKALGTSGLRNLYCYQNKINVLPPSIGHIGTLQILSISNNKLTNLPDEIGDLENLIELYIGGKFTFDVNFHHAYIYLINILFLV